MTDPDLSEVFKQHILREMVLMENFVENVKVEKIKFFGRYEADIFLSILKDGGELAKVKCFIYDDNDLSGFSEGKTATARFCLLTGNAERTNGKNKIIKQISREHTPNHNIIEGEIVELENHPRYQGYHKIVVDCGFFIETDVKKSENFKVGDYVKTEGRLDVHKVSDKDVTE